MDLQTNLAMMESTEFEEKVDIDDLVLASKPVKLAEIEINDIKQETLEDGQQVAFEYDHDLGKEFKVKMEEKILKLCEELHKERSVNSMVDFNLRRSIIISQFVEKIAEFDPLVKMYEKAQESLKEKSNELANIKEEHETVKVTNEALLQKIQELEMDKATFTNQDSSEKNHEIKPFSCKFCDKSFHQAQEVKGHIKIHATISEVEEEKTFMYDDKNCVTNDHSNTMDIPRENNSKIPLKRENMAFQRNNGEQKNENILLKKKLMNMKLDSKERKPTASLKACELCDKTYKNIENLRRHKRKAHTENKNVEEYSCQHCNKKFKFQIDLKDHLRIHREKVKCNICSVKFTRRDNLLKHQRKIHNNKTKIS